MQSVTSSELGNDVPNFDLHISQTLFDTQSTQLTQSTQSSQSGQPERAEQSKQSESPEQSEQSTLSGSEQRQTGSGSCTSATTDSAVNVCIRLIINPLIR